jgi:hypothetical protein
MRGGPRKGTGPKPGPGGTKIDKNIALTADVWAFVTRDGKTAGSAIETHFRKLAAFKAWKSQCQNQ